MSSTDGKPRAARSEPAEVDSSLVVGNSPDVLKQLLLYALQNVTHGFGSSTGRRVQLREAGTRVKVEEEGKVESRVVCVIVVDEDMIHAGGNMHGGCAAFLIDLCSTFAIMVYTHMIFGDLQPGVSQSLNIVYHSPAALGERLRVVNTTLSVGGRAMTACTEIWSESRHRLVASGTHVKMNPSAQKTETRL